jgi:hypothetical protein
MKLSELLDAGAQDAAPFPSFAELMTEVDRRIAEAGANTLATLRALPVSAAAVCAQSLRQAFERVDDAQRALICKPFQLPDPKG